MTFPPHIANAPTPRTDAKSTLCHAGKDPWFYATQIEHARLLERQLIWLTEVVEKSMQLNIVANELFKGSPGTSMIAISKSRLYQIDAALSALNEYKQGTKEV